jgi:hypothetical protein
MKEETAIILCWSRDSQKEAGLVKLMLFITSRKDRSRSGHLGALYSEEAVTSTVIIAWELHASSDRDIICKPEESHTRSEDRGIDTELGYGSCHASYQTISRVTAAEFPH